MKLFHSNYIIRQANIQDLAFLVEIHNETLQSGIYAQLGVNFLQRYYRASILNNNIIFIAQSKSKILGIIELNLHKHSSKIFNMHDFLRLVLIVLKDPRYLYLIFFRLFTKNEFKKMIEISNFAVKKSYRSLGVGSKLLDTSVKYATKKKLSLYTFTHNKRLVGFYLKKMNGKIIKTANLFVYMSYLVRIDIKKLY
jgi:ribosomal protein S18 acetylase RimI-like enzyme